MVAEKDSAWLRALVGRTLIKNGVAKFNGNRSWELIDREFLFLTPELAEGFLTFSTYPIYNQQVIQREKKLLVEHIDSIVSQIGETPFNLIDIYCGDGSHAIEFIRLLNSKTKNPIQIRYCPTNATSYLTNKAIENVKSMKFPNVISFEPLLSSGDGHVLRNLDSRLRTKEFSRHVVLVLESVLASFEINDYLFELSRDFTPNDLLIIGNGIRTGERLVELPKYANNSFNNWFMHLLNDLGINQKDVSYDARFGNSRVELFYHLLSPKTIKINGKSIELKKGDELIVAILYKYYAQELEEFCNMYFTKTTMFTDSDKGYALVICKK